MTEQELELKHYYLSCKKMLLAFNPPVVQYLDKLWVAAQSTFVDPESKCKCVDHKLEGAGPYWRPPYNFLSSNEWATAVPVKINYCPECGRKLQPNETR